MHETDFEDEEHDYGPSRSEQRREALAVLDLAMKLVGESDARLQQIPMDEDLLALVDKPVALGKDAFSALGDRATADHLKASGAKHLLVCGIETPVCIYQTARDALLAGYQVTVLTDCVAMPSGPAPCTAPCAAAAATSLGPVRSRIVCVSNTRPKMK